MKTSRFPLLVVGSLILAALPALVGQSTSSGDVENALKAQADHFRIVRERGEKPYYAPRFDLSGLPHYQPSKLLTGWLRIHGNNYIADGLLGEYWQKAFAKYQPGVRISYYLPTSAGSFGALDYNQADLIFSHRPGFYDLLAYERMKNCDPVEIAAVTGSYDVGGWENSYTILVNSDNPLKGITMEQLDGVFGAERDGGWVGTNWRPDLARGPEKNIRTWGQLGLTGEWADKPIHPYGFSLRYNTAITFCDLVLKGSDKWNEKIHAYGNYMAPDGKRYIEADQITGAIGQDRYAIGFNRYRGERPKVRRLSVGGDDGKLVEHTIDNVQNGSYPLATQVYFYTTVLPGQKMDPMVKEFLRFILSQEGQAEVQRDGKYLPLTADMIREQLKKLEMSTSAVSLALLRRGAALVLSAGAAVFAADAYQPAHYDLSALPPYVKSQRVTGVLRIYGTPLEDLVGKWANAFRGYHGQVRLNAYLINTSQAFAGLVTGSADIGLMGHRQWRNGFQAFAHQFGYAPLEIKFASGSYDDPAGTTPGLMFIVNKKNPLAGLTLEQIDGLYGAQRTGGWVDGQWSTAVARGPEKDLRTWDQLGLTGEWANQPIHLYGSDVTLSNWADLIEREAFHGGTKWNPALNEAPRADIGTKAKGKTRDQLILEAVENDPYAIGFIFQRVVNANHGDVRVLPLAARSGGSFVTPSAETFFNASYPLHNGAYLYLNRVPGQPLPVREKEFVRFVLSREGQQIIADSRLFTPLSAEQVQAELAKLERAINPLA